MKRLMLIGETRSGKSSLIKALSSIEYIPRGAMAVEYIGPFINTPGEFLENRRFYHALITTAADCDILALVQDASRRTSLFPPLFASMFNREVIGIVSKIDHPEARPDLALRFLRNAGVTTLIQTSIVDDEGLESLRQFIC